MSKDGGFRKVIKIKIYKPIPSFQGVELQYNGRYHITSNPLTPSMGVKNYNGQRETYYSQRILPGGGLKIPGRHVAMMELYEIKMATSLYLVIIVSRASILNL